jgi:hypothetical protein
LNLWPELVALQRGRRPTRVVDARCTAFPAHRSSFRIHRYATSSFTRQLSFVSASSALQICKNLFF